MIHSCSSASLSDKRKRKVLTIHKKLEIVSLLNNNHSLAVIASKYGIGKSTISDIKRDQQKLLHFKKQTLDMSMYRHPKTMRLRNRQCDSRQSHLSLSTSLINSYCQRFLKITKQRCIIHAWFKQKRHGSPERFYVRKRFRNCLERVTSLLLVKDGSGGFVIDMEYEVFLAKAKNRLLIQMLSAVDFVPKFREVIESRNISLEHQPEASLYTVTTLHELRSLAITKRLQSG